MVIAAKTVRPVVAAAAALAGVGVLSVGPAGASAPTPRLSAQAFTLTASSALLNVPLNLFTMALSIPAWEVQGINRLADAMIGTGSWQVWGPTNVLGIDEWDPPKISGVVDMMLPIQPFSSVLADQISWWAKANLPMNAGCAAAPGACPDFGALLKSMFKAPLGQLTAGYQFPTVTNPFTLAPTSWSGQYVKLQLGAAFTSLWNYLSGEPHVVQTVPIGDYFTVPLKLAKSVFDAYYPFVQNSEWFNPKTPFSWAFRALAPLICPSCGPEPYANPWLNENYPPKPAATRRPAAAMRPVAAVTASAPAVAAEPPADQVAAAPARDHVGVKRQVAAAAAARDSSPAPHDSGSAGAAGRPHRGR